MKVEEYFKLTRKELIEAIIKKYPKPKTLAISGNSKIGKTVGHISSMAKLSCMPSEWCVKNCYAMWQSHKLINFSMSDRGLSLYTKGAWFSHLSETDPEQLYDLLFKTFYLEDLNVYRFFTEGDWEFVQQINAVKKAISKFPKIKMFFFTRSWQDENLRIALEDLMTLENVKGFASTDKTMPSPPSGWLEAGVLGHNPEVKGIVCPEQLGEVSSCAKCGLCFNKKVNKNILFIDHRAPEYRKLKKLSSVVAGDELIEQRRKLKLISGQLVQRV